MFNKTKVEDNLVNCKKQMKTSKFLKKGLLSEQSRLGGI